MLDWYSSHSLQIEYPSGKTESLESAFATNNLAGAKGIQNVWGIEYLNVNECKLFFEIYPMKTFERKRKVIQSARYLWMKNG